MIVRKAIFTALVVCTVCMQAATSTSWDTNGFNDFLKGRLSGLSVSVTGTLEPGPRIDAETRLDQPAVWALARTYKGEVFAATGHSGQVFRLGSNDKKPERVWSAPQSEVFAICATSDGTVYAGTSPNGAVYRLGEKGSAKEVWRSPAKYIWGLVGGPDGSVFVGTGEPGQIFRIAKDGKAELYFDTGQVNVTALAIAGSRLLAGTDPNGILFDISAPLKATVLYDSALPEIRSIAVAPGGTVYVAAMGGGLSTRTTLTPASVTSSGSGAPVATSSTVITVTEAAEQPSSVTAPQQAQTSSAASATATTAAATQVVETPGVEKSAIYELSPAGAIQTIRSSKDDNVYDLLYDANALLFSTDLHGRVFRLRGRETTLLTELADGPAMRLLRSGDSLYVAMSNPARVFALSNRGNQQASFESPVHDCVSVARWGHLQWSGDQTGITFRTRTGNSARPDATWSAWSQPLTSSESAQISSPPARFVQWRAEWAPTSSARIHSVSLPYLAQNNPPAVHALTVSAVPNSASNKASTAASATSNPNSSYTITVTDTGDAPATTSTSASQIISGQQTTQTQVSWQADDPDGDKLSYSLFFRPEEGNQWRLIRDHLADTSLLLDPDVFADGRYVFRVIASDGPSNAPDFAHESELVSTPVLIDNTPPVVHVSEPRRNNGSIDIDVDAADAASPLRLCEYSLDAGAWQLIEAADGVTDSPHEQFRLRLKGLTGGEHLLVFRVRDAANNAGLAKVIVQ